MVAPTPTPLPKVPPPLPFEVYHKEADSVVFKSSSQLQAEMVAISLALCSLYGTKQHYVVRRGKVIVTTFTTEIAFAAMQTKMRNLILNKRVTSTMPFVPDRFTNLARTRIVKAIEKGESLQFVKTRLNEEVDRYAAGVRSLK